MSVVVESPRLVDAPRIADTTTLPTVQTVRLPVLQPPAPRQDRLPLIDLLRVLAAHLIVWHHLAFYGPLSDVAYQLLPGIIGWLNDWGRCAVQVFFVVGGFVAMQGLMQRGSINVRAAGHIIARRYCRIGGPYVATLILAILANPLADVWMDHYSISAAPTWPQLLAHVAFLQDVLGYDALTAGIWYLAIDFQLGLVLLGLTMLAQRLAITVSATASMLWAMLLPLAAASLFWFNRDPQWDEWCVFFLGSFALGVVAEAVLSRRLPHAAFWSYASLMLLAIAIDWRPRLVVALGTGLVIYAGGVIGLLSNGPRSRWIESAAKSSYSLFLVHFPVCLVVNAFLSRFVLDSPWLCLAGMAAAYLLSVAASVVFYRRVECAFH